MHKTSFSTSQRTSPSYHQDYAVKAATANIRNAFRESYRTHTVNTQCWQNAKSLNVTASGAHMRRSLHFKRLLSRAYVI